jgi:hypothetical protein
MAVTTTTTRAGRRSCADSFENEEDDLDDALDKEDQLASDTPARHKMGASLSTRARVPPDPSTIQVPSYGIDELRILLFILTSFYNNMADIGRGFKGLIEQLRCSATGEWSPCHKQGRYVLTLSGSRSRGQDELGRQSQLVIIQAEEPAVYAGSTQPAQPTTKSPSSPKGSSPTDTHHAQRPPGSFSETSSTSIPNARQRNHISATTKRHGPQLLPLSTISSA